MTVILTPITASDAYWSVANDENRIEDNGLISFDRCVDWLLDLQQSTSDEGLRGLIADTLLDLRLLGPFDADIEDVVLGALASIEVAFEVAAVGRPRCQVLAFPLGSRARSVKEGTRRSEPGRTAGGRPLGRPSASSRPALRQPLRPAG
jgi:hypothetical protein